MEHPRMYDDVDRTGIRDVLDASLLHVALVRMVRAPDAAPAGAARPTRPAPPTEDLR